MRYVGRHRAPRPLYLRMPVMAGVAAALLIGGPALAATTGLLSDSGTGHGLATGYRHRSHDRGQPGEHPRGGHTPSVIAQIAVPAATPFTAIRVRALRTTTSSTSSQPTRTIPSTTRTTTPPVPPTTPPTTPTPTDSPTATATPTPTDSPTTTPTPTGSG